MGRERTPHRIAPLTPGACTPVVLCGISTCFQVLSPCEGQLVHALLTRPPLKTVPCKHSLSPLDLHVLGTPPAFVLSQDQTLIFDLYSLKLSLCVYFFVRIGIDFAFFNIFLLSQVNIFFALSFLLCIVFKVRGLSARISR